MIDENKRFNIILGIIDVVLVLVIGYIISYRNNLESVNIYFNESDIVDVNWESTDMKFNSDGHTFTLIYKDEKVFDKEKFEFDNHTGMIVKDRLYLRSVNQNSIILWFDEAEYRLDRSI